ncbi:MAG: hypothetical protein R3A10_20640 [Caldilineaceae bacterium]
MSESGGFTSMAGARAEGEAPEIGVGMLGYAFMGKAHSNAYRTIPYMMYPLVGAQAHRHRRAQRGGRDRGGQALRYEYALH